MGKSLGGMVLMLYAFAILILFPAPHMFSWILLTVIPEHRTRSSLLNTAECGPKAKKFKQKKEKEETEKNTFCRFTKPLRDLLREETVRQRFLEDSVAVL